jgi:anti-sigma factor RsiW
MSKGERGSVDHDEFRDLIAVYAIGALPSDERDPVESHLRACVECCWDALRYSQAIVRALKDGTLRRPAS